MSNQPVRFERYLELITQKPLEKQAVIDWYKCVKENSPSGILSVIQTTNDNGEPASVSMVRRVRDDKNCYVIPLTRDLTENEIDRIVKLFAASNPELDFDITTNQTSFKKNEREALTLDQEQHIALCLAMAKQKHEDWVRERTDNGWRYGVRFSEKDKTHPLLRPWHELPDKFRKPDLDWPQKLISMLNTQGYAIIRQDELRNLMTLLRGIGE